MPSFFYDSISTHPTPQKDWRSPQKVILQNSFIGFFINLPRKKKDSKNKYVYIYSSQNIGVVKSHERGLCNSIKKLCNNMKVLWKRIFLIL